jgi:hypothetical protein
MQDCSEKTCLPEDSILHHLDIEYQSFAKDVKTAEYRNYPNRRYQKVISRACIPLEKYKTCEEYELKFSSKWRGEYLQQLKEEQPLSFPKKILKRYAVWHSIHDGAINALESHFSVKGFSTSEDHVRDILLRLWAFLPQEFSKNGTDIALQRRHVKWMTQSTDVSMRLKIDNFLNRLVAKFCDDDKGALTYRIQLWEEDPDGDLKDFELLKADILQSGAYRLLVKRLLLQTPLLFWPAVFKSGISRYFEDEVKPSEVYYSSDGDLVVQCGNTRYAGGYEVTMLWSNLLRYQRLEDISRCKRHIEYRFIRPTCHPSGDDETHGRQSLSWHLKT